jgi:hypothetical protein
MPVPLFATEQDLEDFIDVLPTGDGELLNSVRRSKGALLVYPGTRCHALDTEILGSKRKVVVREGPHEGKVGWTVKEWSRAESKMPGCIIPKRGDTPLFQSKGDLSRFIELALERGKSTRELQKHLKSSLAQKVTAETRCNLLEADGDALHILLLDGTLAGSTGWMHRNSIAQRPEATLTTP